jgi:hypothetical protein
MPGFASTDAEYAELEAWEATILAASGVLTGMGINRQLAGKRTNFPDIQIAHSHTLYPISRILSWRRGRPPSSARAASSTAWESTDSWQARETIFRGGGNPNT